MRIYSDLGILRLRKDAACPTSRIICESAFHIVNVGVATIKSKYLSIIFCGCCFAEYEMAVKRTCSG